MRSLGSAVLSSGLEVARRSCRRGGAVVAASISQQRRWLQVSTSNASVVFDIKGESIDGRSTFLDNQSTTAMDPRVVDAMMPLMTWQYGNPHSRSVHLHVFTLLIHAHAHDPYNAMATLLSATLSSERSRATTVLFSSCTLLNA